MDITIKVIVTFLVVFVVGVTIIRISSDLLSSSKNNLENLRKIESKDKMIEKDSFSQNEIKFLSETCFNENYGINGFDEQKLCYILKSNNLINLTNMSSLTLNPIISSVSGNSKTIYIKFSMASNITISD